ncbi:MAG: ComEC/Rec2 family competence protein [Bdellovibrionales bacterium]
MAVLSFHSFAEAFAAERERWFLWVPAGVAAGIAVYFALPFEPSGYFLCAAPALAAGLWLARNHLGSFVLCLAALALALGFNAAQLETRMVAAPMLDRMIGPAPIEGRLVTTEAMPEGARLTLKNPVIPRLSDEKTPAFVRIRMKGLAFNDAPPPGALIRAMAQIGPLSEPVAPNAYDFRRQSFFRNLGGTGWSHSAIEILDPSPPATPWERFLLMFERARRLVTLHVHAHLSGDKAAMTAALLNGLQSGISKNALEAMRVSGLSHLLSISGVHVSMMGLLIYVPLRLLMALIPWVALNLPARKIAAVGAIVATILYTFLVGPQAPTLRSALSTGLVMFAILVDRRAMSMRLVTLAAAAVMLIQPDGVMGPSFQMSFAAVLAMVAAFEKPFDEALARGHLFVSSAPENPESSDELLPSSTRRPWLKIIPQHLRDVILTSLVATAATTPFTIFHFQTFSFYGVIANMIAIPLTSFWIMPCILLTYLTAPFGLDRLFIVGAGWGVDGIISIARFVAEWPFAQLHMPAMPAWSFVAIILGGVWLCLWRRRWRWLGLAPILIGAMYPLVTPLPDLLVAPDGKQWAARVEDGRLAVANLDREAFTVTQWQQRLGNPETLDIHDLPASEHALRCDEAGCALRRAGVTVALPILEPAALEDCELADLVIAPFDIRDCAGKRVIDWSAFRAHGAYALYVERGALRLEASRLGRGARPWSPGWRDPRFGRLEASE